MKKIEKDFFSFTERYHLFDFDFSESFHFLRYQKILFSLFVVCFFLLLVQFLGFSFGLDQSTLFVVFSLLFFILAGWEVRKRRSVFYPEVEKVIFKTRKRFIERRQVIQEKVIVHFPNRSVRKIGNPIILTFATILIFLSWSWRGVVLLGTLSGIVIDIFIFKSSLDLLVLFLAILWLLSIIGFKFRNKVSIMGGLVFLSLCPFLLISEKEFLAEKTANWAYIFLLIGVMQAFIEYAKKRKYCES